jgi:hypothetical protein
MFSHRQHNFVSRPNFTKHCSSIVFTIVVGLSIIAETALAQSDFAPHVAYTIQQQSSGRYLDAYQNDAKDRAVVTRPRQDNPTQNWIFNRMGNSVYAIQQQSQGRYLDAYQSDAKDWAAVTRSMQGNATQNWIVTEVGNDTYTIRQQSTGRYMDAHEYQAKDWAVVTRSGQSNSTQRWIIRRVSGGQGSGGQGSGVASVALSFRVGPFPFPVPPQPCTGRVVWTFTPQTLTGSSGKTTQFVVDRNYSVRPQPTSPTEIYCIYNDNFDATGLRLGTWQIQAQSLVWSTTCVVTLHGGTNFANFTERKSGCKQDATYP